jgi:hypothetical protein
MFKQLDQYGMEYKLTFNKMEKFKNTLGGFMTLLTYMVAIAMILSFGKEIIVKQNPNIVNSMLTDSQRQNYSLVIPFSVSVEEGKGGLINDWYRYLTFIPTYRYSSLLPPDKMIENFQLMNMTFCNSSMFENAVKNEFDFLAINNTWCLTYNPMIGGYFNIDYYMYVQVELTFCVNTTANNNYCYPKDKIDAFVKKNNKMLAIYYQNYIFKPTNYKDPYDYYIKSYYHNIGFASCRRIDIETMNQNITTDAGFFLSSLNYHGEQTIDTIDTDYYVKQSADDECLTKINIMVSENNYLVNRSYMKIQDLLAQVGGLLGIIQMACGTFVSFAYTRRMQEHIIHNLFKIDKDEILKNEASLNNNNNNKVNSVAGTENKNNIKETPNQINLSNSNRLGGTERAHLDNSLVYPNKPPDLKSKIYKKENSLDIPMQSIDEKNTENIKIKDGEIIKKVKVGFNRKAINDGGNERNIIGKKQRIMRKLDSLVVENNKSKSQKGETRKFFFSLCNNLFMNICCCKCGNIKKLDDQFKKLYSYSISYTDVITIAKRFNEIDKIKFLLLNEKQMAIFNLKTEVTNPFATKKNKLTELFIYNQDSSAQEVVLKEFIQSLNHGKDPSTIDRKLIDLCGEDPEL